MAWGIVKKSLATTIYDIKRYIPIIISAFISIAIVVLLWLFTNLSPLVLELAFSAISMPFIVTPCFLIIYNIPPLQFLRKNIKSVIGIWVINLVLYSLVLFCFSFAFPSPNDKDVTSLSSVCSLVIGFISLVINCATIRIIKTDSSALGAIFTNSDIFSRNKGFNIWLYIKLIMINALFSIVISLCVSIVQAVFSIIPSTTAAVIPTVFSSVITLLYNHVYTFVQLSNYYEEVFESEL